MGPGDQFKITLHRTNKRMTINTKDYGGMPKAHASFGEVDRKVRNCLGPHQQKRHRDFSTFPDFSRRVGIYMQNHDKINYRHDFLTIPDIP